MKPLSPQQVTRLRQMLATAQQAQQSGLTSQAEGLYRDVLKQAPDAWDVHHLLGILLATSNRPQEAAKHFRQITKANPAHAASHANLANALSESGQLDEAITEFKRALTLDPSLIGAQIALGETMRRAKHFDKAIACFKTILDKDKVNHAAFNGLGLAYRDIDDLPRALECFEHAVGLAPKNAEYHANFGIALRRYELDDLAAEQLYHAVLLRPDWLDALVLLAEVLEKQRRFDEAKEVYDRALQLSPNNPELVERTGYVYLDMGDTEQALSMFSKVLSEHPVRYMALLGMGRSHMEAGHTTEAASTLETLVKLHPTDAAGYFYLAASRKFTPDDPLIPQLLELVNTSESNVDAATSLNFALGKIYDDCKLWDKAFSHYARGNALRNQKHHYDPVEEEAYINAMISAFGKELFSSHSEFINNAELPVVIIGMPRSGTTLTEQIISSHPQVIGAGEVSFWSHARDSVPYLLGTDQPYPDCIQMMHSDHAKQISDKYIHLLKKIAGPGTGPARVTDKMPHNFMNLGLIALLFPKAQIIHCKRDAMDNCLSIFFQNFVAGHHYAYDLSNIGHHYRQYERLMAHWQAVLPGRILDINYEDTIADPEYWSRKLIAHVGLEWDEACLAPHKQERTVKTASHWQVRQPIYKTSVQRWKNYEKHLTPLKNALGFI